MGLCGSAPPPNSTHAVSIYGKEACPDCAALFSFIAHILTSPQGKGAFHVG